MLSSELSIKLSIKPSVKYSNKLSLIFYIKLTSKLPLS